MKLSKIVLGLAVMISLCAPFAANAGNPGQTVIKPLTTPSSLQRVKANITPQISCQALHPANSNPDLSGVLSDPYCCVQQNPPPSSGNIINNDGTLSGATPQQQYDTRPLNAAERTECLQKNIAVIGKLSSFLRVQILPSLTGLASIQPPDDPLIVTAIASDIPGLEEDLTNALSAYSNLLSQFRDTTNSLRNTGR